MAAADVPKTAEELRREIEELHRQQREVRAHSTPTPRQTLIPGFRITLIEQTVLNSPFPLRHFRLAHHC